MLFAKFALRAIRIAVFFHFKKFKDKNSEA